MNKPSPQHCRQAISAKTLRKTLRLVGDEFTFTELKQKMNERKVFGSHDDSVVYQRIHRMKNIGAIEIKSRGRNETHVYRKKELYRD